MDKRGICTYEEGFSSLGREISFSSPVDFYESNKSLPSELIQP